MLIAYIPVIIALIGLLLWVFAGNATLKEAGKILFFCGVLVTTFGLAGKAIKLP